MPLRQPVTQVRDDSGEQLHALLLSPQRQHWAQRGCPSGGQITGNGPYQQDDQGGASEREGIGRLHAKQHS